MPETILTRHPQGKRGIRMSKEKYDRIRAAIEAILSEQPGLNFVKLADAVDESLRDSYSGSVAWYTISVKLDMEAAGVLERIPGTKPEGLRLTGGNK